MSLSPMKIIEAVVVILIVALGVSFVLNYSLYASNQQLRSEFNSLNETLAFPQSVSVTDAPLGLNLSIAVNTTLLQSGQGIEITINETNTLDALNTVSATTGWQSTPQLSLGPCGVGDYPMGLAICQGYYTPSSISSAEPLYIYAPGTFACPMLIRLITSYTFQPLSNMASISPPSNSFFMPMNSSFAANGYWTGNLKGQTEFSNFSPGIYTVVGGDEWGQLVLLHFVVI